ncbi:hypothetical protein XENORESO_005841 [Xenotaenia resolanae]|uniref:Uncharacterized protein n=1 Tax=Xenotaenia resolanae TaxID=208358 RepID=A0ABV0X836_9TELE
MESCEKRMLRFLTREKYSGQDSMSGFTELWPTGLKQDGVALNRDFEIKKYLERKRKLDLQWYGFSRSNSSYQAESHFHSCPFYWSFIPILGFYEM